MKKLKYIIAAAALLGACGAANATSMSQVDVLTQQALGVGSNCPAYDRCVADCSSESAIGRPGCMSGCNQYKQQCNK